MNDRERIDLALAIGWLVGEGYEVEKGAVGYTVVDDPEGKYVGESFKENLICGFAAEKGCPWLQPEKDAFEGKDLTPEELSLKELHFGNGMLNAAVTGEATKAFVASMATMFTEAHGINFVTTKGFHPELGFLEFTVQRTNARTVADVAAWRGHVIARISEVYDRALDFPDPEIGQILAEHRETIAKDREILTKQPEYVLTNERFARKELGK